MADVAPAAAPAAPAAADKAKTKKAAVPFEFALVPAYMAVVAVTLAAQVATVPVFTHVLVITSALIYIGAHQSVHNNAPGGEGMETMSSRDAYMFPLIGSAFLLSVYLVFKFLPAEYVNVAVKVYFVAIGVLVMGATLSKFLQQLVLAGHVEALTRPVARVRIPLVSPDVEEGGAATTKSGEPNDGKTDLSVLDLVGFALAAAVAAWWVRDNHWIASNLFGIAFSIQGIEFLSLGSYFNGAVLLCGLFVYDVFWVFGTDVMVTVARSFDAPIKLLFPRPEGPPSLLGLGDIVIPGIFIALLLRFDVHQAQKRGRPVTRYYFWSCMAGYVVGLGTTLGVMYYFEAAQPALLYLVPTCLGSSLIAAFARGEIAELTKWEEEGDEEEEEEKKGEDKKQD